MDDLRFYVGLGICVTVGVAVSWAVHAGRATLATAVVLAVVLEELTRRRR